MSGVGLVSDPVFLSHDPGTGHPECPQRLTAIMQRLEVSGLLGQVESIPSRSASEEDLLRAHTPEHIERVRAACAQAPASLDPDTHVSTGSWDAALAAVGAVLLAAERVQTGRWQSAFCPVRPPGHHAERGRAMGFCLFNSVAIAAMSLVDTDLKRVAILDWDVHHGNGTQRIFEEDPRVLYVSLHQSPLYPGTGSARESGRGPGRGTTLNLPLAAGSDDRDWLGALEQKALPTLEDFAPELILISAGFDAHALDPVGGCRLSTEGFRRMTQSTLEVARRVASGRVVSVLEGGYHLEALGAAVEAHLGELSEAQAS